MTSSTSNTRKDAKKSDAATAKKAAQDLAHNAEREAHNMSAAVADIAHTKATDAKDGVADEVSSVSNALRRASEDLREGSPQERAFDAVSGSLADLSDSVRSKDITEMVDDVSDFARRNPVTFLGGAALLGFAAVRMAKATQRDHTPSPAGDA